MDLKEFASILDQKGHTHTDLVLTDNGELGFYLSESGWRTFDLVDDFCAFGRPMPAFIPNSAIEAFYTWLVDDRKAEHSHGRRFGENAMRAAIRNLIGAAPLIDLDPTR